MLHNAVAGIVNEFAFDVDEFIESRCAVLQISRQVVRVEVTSEARQIQQRSERTAVEDKTTNS